MVVVHVNAAGDAILGVFRDGSGMSVAGIQEAFGLFAIFLPQTVDDVSVQGHRDRGRVGAGKGTVVSYKKSASYIYCISLLCLEAAELTFENIGQGLGLRV